MACFSPALITQFLVWLVIVIAVVAVVQIVVPWILSKLGPPADSSIIIRILQIVVWAFVAIAIIYFIMALIGCIGLPPR